MLFIDCVNRIFRYNGIIRGDTDAITSFSQTQHQASLQLAMIAVQDELTDLIAEKMIPYERGEGTLTLATNTRTYSLPNEFRSFSGFPHFYDATQNTMIPPYKGGLDQLELDIPNYKTQTGYPSWWYWDSTTTKIVGFFQTPDSTLNGRALTFEYEKSVLVSTQNDTIPFHNDEECNLFTQMASRRFKYMFEDTENKADIVLVLDNDQSYRQAKARLKRMIKGENPSNFYNAIYA